MRHALLCLLLSGAAVAADTPPDHGAATVPGNGGVDPVTARRAEKAAQDYLDQQEAAKTPPDADASSALADAEVMLLEAKTFLDQGDATKAGGKYVDAGAKLKAIPADQRLKLGERYRKATAKLTELSRALLATDAVDPASASKDPGAPTPAETGVPAEEPAAPKPAP
jgi:hypothetical protein